MGNKPLDRRIQKTLHSLQNALVELISEKGYDAVTIQEILDRANVGRSTFYAHFENKDQLLRSLLTRLNERFEEGIRQLVAENADYEAHSAHMPFRALQFVEQNRVLFKSMLDGQSGQANPLYDYLYVIVHEHFRMMLELRCPDVQKQELAARFYTHAFIGALAWWLENDLPYSAEEFGQIINQFTLPGLKAAFGD